MSYFVKAVKPKALPLFEAKTFSQVVKWCLKAQKEKVLMHPEYEIWGAELKRDPKELVCFFYADDFGDDLV